MLDKQLYPLMLSFFWQSLKEHELKYIWNVTKNTFWLDGIGQLKKEVKDELLRCYKDLHLLSDADDQNSNAYSAERFI